eukprot:241699-Chlamydomonas_euryale.AAC.7
MHAGLRACRLARMPIIAHADKRACMTACAHAACIHAGLRIDSRCCNAQPSCMRPRDAHRACRRSVGPMTQAAAPFPLSLSPSTRLHGRTAAAPVLPQPVSLQHVCVDATLLPPSSPNLFPCNTSAWTHRCCPRPPPTCSPATHASTSAWTHWSMSRCVTDIAMCDRPCLAARRAPLAVLDSKLHVPLLGSPPTHPALLESFLAHCCKNLCSHTAARIFARTLLQESLLAHLCYPAPRSPNRTPLLGPAAGAATLHSHPRRNAEKPLAAQRSATLHSHPRRAARAATLKSHLVMLPVLQRWTATRSAMQRNAAQPPTSSCCPRCVAGRAGIPSLPDSTARACRRPVPSARSASSPSTPRSLRVPKRPRRRPS